jgi:SAM-dependent methyltransferase
VPVLDLGEMPLVARLADAGGRGEPEPRYPLQVVWCGACALMQIAAAPGPETLFAEDYHYHSSFSASFVDHARRFAEKMIAGRTLGHGSLVLEIACNDGYLLRHFLAAGIDVLGIDPASGPVAAARAAGVTVREAFFTRALARDLRNEGRAPDLIVGNNVLAHVPDPNDLVAGVRALLKPGGIASFEVPYVRDLVESTAFDTIYHEHHCYFSLTALTALFARHGLHIVDVERLWVHGGSLRLFAGHAGMEPALAVSQLLGEERQCGVADGSFLDGFARRVGDQIARLRDELLALRASGATIAAYGAAAKGTVLLNAASLGSDIIDFVVDLNPAKQGRFMPGLGIPILAADALRQRQPDYALVLAWNFADEIIGQQAEYLDAGGCFIVPAPQFRKIRAHR